jgi:hypothetical protein
MVTDAIMEPEVPCLEFACVISSVDDLGGDEWASFLDARHHLFVLVSPILRKHKEAEAEARALIAGLAEKTGCRYTFVDTQEQVPETILLHHLATRHSVYQRQLESYGQTSVVLASTSRLTPIEPAHSLKHSVDILFQDALLNGSAKSICKPYAGTLADDFGAWFSQSFGLSAPSVDSLQTWPHSTFAVQASMLLLRPKSFFETLAHQLSIGSIQKDFVSSSWFYIVDPSPFDFTIIPFHGGRVEGDSTESFDLRRKKLETSVMHACRITRKKVMIGVQGTEDHEFVQNAFTSRNPTVQPFRIPDLSSPDMLPVMFCSCFQQQKLAESDVVCYTEADQTIGGTDLASHARRIRAAPTGTVLVPHRLQLPDNEASDDKMSIVLPDSKTYVLTNTNPDSSSEWQSKHSGHNYYPVNTVHEAFAGAFITTFASFRGILFTLHHNLRTQSACFSAFYHYGNRCMKSVDPKGLYAVHLRMKEK